MRRIAAVPLALLALTGCGQATTDTGVDDFKGEDQKVAQVIADLAENGSKRDQDAICANQISSALTQRIKEAGTTCQTEMKQAIADADGFDLEVKRVNVTGSTATAVVEGTDSGKKVERTFTLQRDAQSDWKILRFST